VTAKEQAIAAIAAHQAAIDRGSSKAAQHEKSIAYYRRKFDIEPPISFGRHNPELVMAQRAEEDYRTGRGPNPINGKFRNN
jgi:thiamine biosynthesis protein ThiC